MDIAGFDSIEKLNAKINYGIGESHSQIIPVAHLLNDRDQFIVVAIEWDETSIIWFLNERAYYQANRSMESYARSIIPTEKSLKLPFENAFYLMFHIGVEPFSYPVYLKDEFDDYNKSLSWERPCLEIDYIRVYKKEIPISPWFSMEIN